MALSSTADEPPVNIEFESNCVMNAGKWVKEKNRSNNFPARIGKIISMVKRGVSC